MTTVIESPPELKDALASRISWAFKACPVCGSDPGVVNTSPRMVFCNETSGCPAIEAMALHDLWLLWDKQ